MGGRESAMKIVPVAIAAIIVISSTTMIDVMNNANRETEEELNPNYQQFQSHPSDVNPIITENGIWFSVDGSDLGTTTESFVAISDTAGITLVAEFNGFLISPNDTISMPGTSSMKLSGKPDLPRLINYLEIPHDVNISLEVVYGVPELLEGYDVAPALQAIVPIWNVTHNRTLIYDEAVYSSNAFFPSYNVSMEGGAPSSTIIMRGRRLLEISFYPIQYSPGLSNLLFYPKFVVKVKYDEPAQIEPVPARLWSEPFERLYEAFLLNYNPWEPESGTSPWSPPESECPPGATPASTIEVTADYLIITHVSFKAHADELAAWKTQKGLPAEVITTQQIQEEYPGLSLEEGIAQLIKDAYDTWARGPTYVLLFGDCEFVPNGYGVVHTATIPDITDYNNDDIIDFEMDENHYVPDTSPKQYYVFDPNNGKIGTDSVYFTVHGDDYVPDIIYGRISVDTATEAETIVNKILLYEQSPPENPDFYKNFLAAAHFEFFDPWTEDDPPPDPYPPLDEEYGDYQFVRYAEDILLHLEGLEQLGYAGHRAYSAILDDGTPAKFHNRDNPDNPIIFGDTTIYEHLDHISWIDAGADAGADEIALEFNSAEGRFLVYYNDHGDSINMVWPYKFPEAPDWRRKDLEGWGAPRFTSSDLTNLVNGAFLPLVISSACNTGWFDGEIDETVLGSRFETVEELESFSEIITRMEGGGAIAAIGASRLSWTLASADMLDGIIQAFWPGHLSWQNQPIYGMGAALLLGKINTASIWGYEDNSEEMKQYLTKTTFQEYHLFGDPETQLWTAPPSKLKVSYPNQISTDGPQKFVVTVLDQAEPVYFAKVCIQSEDVYEVGYTNSYGQVLFEIETSSTQQISVTVTKPNFIPRIKFIEVLDCSATLTVEPAQEQATESVAVTLTDFEGGDAIHIYYDETELVLSPDDTIDIPGGPDGFANIKANDSDEVAIFLFKRYDGGPPVDPYVYSQHDDTTWHLANGILTYDNPCIEIYEVVGTREEWIDSNDLIELRNYNVHVTVHNNLDEVISGATVTLAWAMFSMGREWTLINTIPALVPDIPAHGQKEVSIPWAPTIPGHICLNATVFHLNDENLNNNVGQENTDVSVLESPGESWFLVGNPTDEDASVYLEVRQQCSLDDIWSAEIVGLSHQDIPSGGEENISLQIISPPGVPEGEARLFTVSLYINGEYQGGISVKGVQANETTTPTTTARDGLDPLLLAAIGAGTAVVIILIVGVIYSKKRS